MTIEEFATIYTVLAKQLKGDHDAVGIKAYFKVLGGVERELVAMAAQQMATKLDFFPKTSEWLETAKHIEHERVDRQRQALRSRARAGLPPLCEQCDDTGWQTGDGGARRCGCAELRRQEVLGLQPMPTVQPAKALHA